MLCKKKKYFTNLHKLILTMDFSEDMKYKLLGIADDSPVITNSFLEVIKEMDDKIENLENDND